MQKGTRFKVSWSLVVSVLAAAPTTVAAGGLEYSSPGTRALGRGGAFHVKADDPMALDFNPANLAALDGVQMSFQFNNAFYDACFQRRLSADEGNTYTGLLPASRFTVFDGEVEPGPGRSEFPGDEWGGTQLPRVCQESFFAPTASFVGTMRLSDELGLGFGMLGPAAVGSGTWGEGDGTVVAPDGNLVPSPGRYMLVSQNNLIIYPTIGIAWRPVRWLRVGLAASWGIAAIESTVVTRESSGNESPDEDILAEVQASDAFVPSLNASVTITPMEQLELMAGFRWTDGIDGSGTMTLETGTFGIGQAGVAVPSRVPTRTDIDGTRVRVSQPWVASFGVRWRQPREVEDGSRSVRTIGNLEGPVSDGMTRDAWDIELNVRYEGSSAYRDTQIDIPEGRTAEFIDVDTAGGTSSSQLALPSRVVVPARWKDQLAIRLGGDWNVLPGQLALRGGMSFETNGIDDGVTGLRFAPGTRLGVHAGITLRVDRFDLSLAYAPPLSMGHRRSVRRCAAPPDRNHEPCARFGGHTDRQCRNLLRRLRYHLRLGDLAYLTGLGCVNQAASVWSSATRTNNQPAVCTPLPGWAKVARYWPQNGPTKTPKSSRSSAG